MAIGASMAVAADVATAGATKTCPRCGMELPLEAFSPHHRCKGGCRGQCRRCVMEYWRGLPRSPPGACGGAGGHGGGG